MSTAIWYALGPRFESHLGMFLWSLLCTHYYIVNWRINKLRLPHSLYSGTKHIPLSSQRPFHFHCSYWRLFHSDQTNTKLYGVFLHNIDMLTKIVGAYLTRVSNLFKTFVFLYNSWNSKYCSLFMLVLLYYNN